MIPKAAKLERLALDGEVYGGRGVRDSVRPADMRCHLERVFTAARASGGAGVVGGCDLM